MPRRWVHFLVLISFGSVFGHYTMQTLGPIDVSDHQVGGDVVCLCAAEPPERNLFLRRELFLPKTPRSGWLQIIGTDSLELFINGQRIDQKDEQGYPVAIVTNLSGVLKKGKNVIAIVARQGTLDLPPAVAVDGAYSLGDGELAITAEGPWRYGSFFERGRDYWFSADFDASHWPLAEKQERRLVANIAVPPRAITATGLGKWISPGPKLRGTVALRRQFHVPERIAGAWLGIFCSTPHRLAVNGTIIAIKEEALGTRATMVPTEWVYDLKQFVRRGDNFVTLLATEENSSARLLAEIEIVGVSGARYILDSDDRWQWQVPARDDWLRGSTDISAWQACLEETGVAVLDRSSLPRKLVKRQGIPPSVRNQQYGIQGLLSALLLMLAWIAVRVMGSARSAGEHGIHQKYISPAVLALVPGTILLGGLMIVAHDPRVANQSVYRLGWLAVAVGSIILQWMVLPWLTKSKSIAAASLENDSGDDWLRRLVVPAVLVLLLVGGALRVRDLTTRPLSPDEVSMYRATTGFLERGFPSIEIHPDIPIVYAATSELVYCFSAATGLFTDDERLMVRAPVMVWGTLTIFLFFWCGKNLFGPAVGLTAAALFALSPYCIGMANLGRYYSQLQALTLLTVYFFYKTIAPAERLDRRALWLTVVCFICMFYSWEGSALLAVPLMIAAIIHRRASIASILCEPEVWKGIFIVGLAIALQNAHRSLMQIARPLFGSGASDVSLTAMWRFPSFDVWYYVRAATWNGDTLLPVLGLWAAGVMAIRHRYRHQIRVLLIVFLGAAIFQAMVLPVTGKRYSYHLVPMWLLLASVAIVSVGRRLAMVDVASANKKFRGYAKAVATALVLAYAGLGCGYWVDLSEMTTWRTATASLGALKQPGQQPSVGFVLEHLEPDDIVIVNGPHVIDHYLGRPSDYWIQTEMRLQATMDDHRAIPLHRLKGTVMLRDAAHVKDVFARHRRVWFITEPAFNARTNTDLVNRFIRTNMDVVYEDYSSLVLFRGSNHLPVSLQMKTEETLEQSKADYLP